MKRTPTLAFASALTALCLQTGMLAAQDTTAPSDNGGRRNRGNFDPAQFQQRMLENVRSSMGFTNDVEWAAVQPLMQKVIDLRRETLASGMPRFNRRSADTADANRGNETRASSFFKTSPEADSLQKLLDDKVPVAEVKAALERYRTARKDKEAQLTAAQDALRNVLTVRQEAQAALLGLLP